MWKTSFGPDAMSVWKTFLSLGVNVDNFF